MANPYDQFDAPAAGVPTGSANPYDQFDSQSSPAAIPNLPGSNIAEPLFHLGSQMASLPVAAGASLYKLATAPWGLKAKQASQAAGDMQQAMTYQPRTPVGQSVSSGLDTLMSLPGRAVGWATSGIADNPAIKGVLGPTGSQYLQAGANLAGNAIPALIGMKGAGAVTDAGATALRGARSTVDSPQSISAAAASPSLVQVSPELRQAISTSTARAGGAVNPQTLARHIEADTLPVRMRLTEGQATQDPVLISNEMNMRARYPQMAARLNEQNGQLTQNLQSLRDQAGPDVFSTNAVEHGDTLMGAYRDLDQAAQNQIRGHYEALRDANAGNFPVDARVLLSNASARLHQQLLFEHAPTGPMAQMARLADTGNMTLEQFEALRTNLARIQRSATDGNERAAAGVIRNTMEELPLSAGTAEAKGLADTARNAARQRFQAMEADPAYHAAVNETVSPDRFIQRFVINAPRDDVTRMLQSLAGNEPALQTLQVAVLDHLRNAAGVGPGGSGNFSQAAFNRALASLDPKLRPLVGAQTAEHLEQLGNVARYTQAQPRGAYVNNSNSAVALLGGYGAHAIEGAVNVAAHGIPVGTWSRKAIENFRGGRSANQALAPGAGLMRLQPPNPGLMGGP